MIVEPVEGGVRLRLDRGFVDFLLQFPDVLDAVEPGIDDPASRRLMPAVYPDDPDANEEWWGFMSEELDRSRAADRTVFREVMEAAVEGTVVETERVHGLLRVLVESRLALAARLGIETESDYERVDVVEAAVLDSLGRLQVAFLAALQGF